MSTVLVFAVGPVQEFISTAVKGRDLCLGSWLLSELARAAGLAALEAGSDHAAVMPRAVELRDVSASISNKLIVWLESADPARVAEAMAKAVRGRLADLAAGALDRVRVDRFERSRAEAQVAALPELYWAFADEDAAGGYRQARRLAEHMLAARKTRRDFGPVTWGDTVPKSSLDGAHESVIHEAVYDDLDPAALRRRVGAKKGERLSGIDLLKRWGHEVAGEAARGAQVLSTSHVASWSVRRIFCDRDSSAINEAHNAFEAYAATLRRMGAQVDRLPHLDDPVLGRCDGHLLFANRLADLLPDERSLEDARAALSALWAAWRDIGGEHGFALPSEPPPYYAVLVADGDNMGAAIDALDRDGHDGFTRELSGFAGRASGIVAEHHGHAVYAGGDDVLALVPATEALACADALRHDFTEA